jgi:TIR domain/Hypothetical protein (DUF2513)
MRRDQDLLEKLLLRAEGEQPAPDLSEYSEQERAYHTAILIDSGLVRGVISRDEMGRVRATATTELTAQGHDYLEAMRKERQERTEHSHQIDVFVSHSSQDAALARELVELLVFALGISTTRIRCTSVDGFRLEAGVLITDQLQREVFESRVVLALLTPASLKSAYVLFELGARWGAKKKLIPLLAAGASSSNLEGPLKGINALQCDRAGVMQTLTEIGNFLGRPWGNPAAADGKIENIIRLHVGEVTSAPDSTPNERDGYHKHDVISILEAWLGANINTLANRVIDFDVLDSQLHLPTGSSAKYVEYLGRDRKGLKVIRRGPKTILFERPKDRTEDT